MARITRVTLSDIEPGQRESGGGLRATAAAVFGGPYRRWVWGGLVTVAVAVVAVGGVAAYYLADPGRRQMILQNGPAYPYSTAAERTPDRLRVLFLGNSFTQFNGGLALILQRLAESAGKRPTPVFDQQTKFGATWAELWAQTTCKQTIAEGDWDYVVLQDYSRAAMVYRTEMDQYGRTFAKAIRDAGAKPLYFMTWARSDEMNTTRQIAGAYTAVAAENRARVVPAGLAWAASLHGRPRLVLHTADKKHPTPAGSYLTACVFYAVLYHESPHGLTPTISDGTTVYVNLAPADATYLQDVAWQTVQQVARPAATRPATRSATRPATRPATHPTTRPASRPT